MSNQTQTQTQAEAEAQSQTQTQKTDSSNRPLLVAAVLDGDVALCAALLAAGDEVVNTPQTYGNATPLYFAARGGNAAMCELLLNHGAAHTPDVDGCTPLFMASQFGHAEVASCSWTGVPITPHVTTAPRR